MRPNEKKNRPSLLLVLLRASLRCVVSVSLAREKHNLNEIYGRVVVACSLAPRQTGQIQIKRKKN